MRDLSTWMREPGRVTINGAPEGRDALALADLLATTSDVDFIFVARDDTRLDAMASALRLFAPDLDPLVFPAWDCLPYDRVSPRADISAARLTCLSELAAGRRKAGQGRLLLTTVAAITQKVPPRETLEGTQFSSSVGETLDIDALTRFLSGNGYQRIGTVMEAGEFAVRGGIVDLFPAGAEMPLRLDLFGDTLDAIRRFDPLSQRTTGSETRFELVPVCEIDLSKDAIARFRAGYRELFGAVTKEDSLYESVSAGRRHPGTEHWLPLFHDRLDTLFDYMPGAALILDHLCEEVREQRGEAIADYYQARTAAIDMASTLSGGPYKPVPPDRMFIDDQVWDTLCAKRAVADFSPFRAPESSDTMIDLNGRRAREFSVERRTPDVNLFDAVSAYIGETERAGRKVAIACYTTGSRDRLCTLLREHGMEGAEAVDGWSTIDGGDTKGVAVFVLAVEHGFETPTLVVLGEQDILGDRLARPARRSRRAADFLSEASSLETDDLVVHIDHGIGQYRGLETIEAGGAPHDCLLLGYAGGDKLYLPVENIEMLSRFGSGGSAEAAALDRLGGASWQARKARLKKRLRDMADELILVAAERALMPAPALEAPAGLYEEFAAQFPYTETDDQSRAIDDCLTDIAADTPMDRLVCGDVGFGKTEVALRASFVTAFAGKQVAVIVPTTLLARQHFKTFSERFAGSPIRVGHISRLVSVKDAAEVRNGLADGTIDIVVGTHSLLSKTVSFSDLGLLIIDEEQHFGVAQKERMKALKADVHVLTLTATPIPRTLQLAMSGVRSLSLIATPPVDRLAVRTFVTPYDPVIVREAILRERHRGGQVFYICPRIEDLDKVAAELREIVPEIRFVIAHGQMTPQALEDAMTAFYDGSYDLLLATSIIESGLDIPTANTLLVHRADMFGLAQLYQLRGRVGRSKQRAYAYFTVPSEKLLKGAAEKRLHVIQTLDTLGAGFSLASHDMDIRGAGNLLGEEQSGHIKEVGLELYQQLLEEAVQAARGRGEGSKGDESSLPAETWSPQIAVGSAVLIPEAYVTDLGVRLGLYRRLGGLATDADIDSFAAELVDRFGPLPDEVENLLKIVKIKRLCRDAGVEKIDAGPKGAVIAFRDNRFAAPDKLIAFIGRNATNVRVRPDHRMVVSRAWKVEGDRLTGLAELVGTLADMAA
jgi:transcription-repair coupling factor (superfamily II helicase)